MLRPFIVIGFLSAATGAFADPVQLANDELKQTVSGATVEIDTPLGTTVPMRFGRDGLVSAEAGVLAPVLGSAKDRGRWWVDGEKLCTKWFRWFDAGVRCLTISLEGTRVYWHKIDDGEKGTGTLIAAAAPKETPAATVVAKADPTPQAKPLTQETPSPVTIASTTQEKRATRLAGPPREVADGPVAAAQAPKADTAPTAPAAVASAEAKQVEPDGDERPAMRFGSAGLMDSSTFSNVGTSVAATQATEPKEAASIAPVVPASSDEPKAMLPAAKPPAYSVASGPETKKPTVQRQASLDAGGAARRVPQKRVGKAQARDAAATSSSRSVALYRVTGVAGYDVLNVRRGPSEEHVSIASIPPTGRRVEITGQCREAWCPIRYGGITGWVNRYYLAEEGSREEQWSGASNFSR